jgi:MoaA/NifB/PqqE/SkfB family radical SAM enzyme
MGTQRRSTLRGRRIAAQRKAREYAMVARALASTSHPVLAQIVPARFCNLSCTYCNEYDKVSEPVELAEMLRRIDHLGRLGTAMIGISGGEPLTHPALDDIIRRMRKTGAIAGMITNGYLLNVERIERLNAAGLDHMQISIDNLVPDDVSMKSLKVLDKKLQMLADHAEFHVNINSVVGGGFKDPNDALVISKRALELGFESTIGIIHDGDGQLKALNPDEARVYFEMQNRKKTNYAQFDKFQEAIAQGRPNDWRCRAGSRYLYICEDGLVHYCSQQRGFPGVPLAQYTTADVKREFLTAKSCTASATSTTGARRKPASSRPAQGLQSRRWSTSRPASRLNRRMSGAHAPAFFMVRPHCLTATVRSEPSDPALPGSDIPSSNALAA